MLVWVCDLVIASDDAEFSDLVVAFGINGHEFFTHPWEVGPRKAKEMPFTGEAFSAQAAHDLGMVNHAVPLSDLGAFTRRMAAHIATRPSIGLKLAQQAVNQALDAQGHWTAIQAAFSIHQVAHSHHMQVFGDIIRPERCRNRERAREGPAPHLQEAGPRRESSIRQQRDVHHRRR